MKLFGVTIVCILALAGTSLAQRDPVSQEQNVTKEEQIKLEKINQQCMKKTGAKLSEIEEADKIGPNATNIEKTACYYRCYIIKLGVVSNNNKFKSYDPLVGKYSEQNLEIAKNCLQTALKGIGNSHRNCIWAFNSHYCYVQNHI